MIPGTLGSVLRVLSLINKRVYKWTKKKESLKTIYWNLKSKPQDCAGRLSISAAAQRRSVGIRRKSHVVQVGTEIRNMVDTQPNSGEGGFKEGVKIPNVSKKAYLVSGQNPKAREQRKMKRFASLIQVSEWRGDPLTS